LHNRIESIIAREIFIVA